MSDDDLIQNLKKQSKNGYIKIDGKLHYENAKWPGTHFKINEEGIDDDVKFNYAELLRDYYSKFNGMELINDGFDITLNVLGESFRTTMKHVFDNNRFRHSLVDFCDPSRKYNDTQDLNFIKNNSFIIYTSNNNVKIKIESGKSLNFEQIKEYILNEVNINILIFKTAYFYQSTDGVNKSKLREVLSYDIVGLNERKSFLKIITHYKGNTNNNTDKNSFINQWMSREVINTANYYVYLIDLIHNLDLIKEGSAYTNYLSYILHQLIIIKWSLMLKFDFLSKASSDTFRKFNLEPDFVDNSSVFEFTTSTNPDIINTKLQKYKNIADQNSLIFNLISDNNYNFKTNNFNLDLLITTFNNKLENDLLPSLAYELPLPKQSLGLTGAEIELEKLNEQLIEAFDVQLEDLNVKEDFSIYNICIDLVNNNTDEKGEIITDYAPLKLEVESYIMNAKQEIYSALNSKLNDNLAKLKEGDKVIYKPKTAFRFPLLLNSNKTINNFLITNTVGAYKRNYELLLRLSPTLNPIMSHLKKKMDDYQINYKLKLTDEFMNIDITSKSNPKSFNTARFVDELKDIGYNKTKGDTKTLRLGYKQINDDVINNVENSFNYIYYQYLKLFVENANKIKEIMSSFENLKEYVNNITDESLKTSLKLMIDEGPQMYPYIVFFAIQDKLGFHHQHILQSALCHKLLLYEGMNNKSSGFFEILDKNNAVLILPNNHRDADTRFFSLITFNEPLEQLDNEIPIFFNKYQKHNDVYIYNVTRMESSLIPHIIQSINSNINLFSVFTIDEVRNVDLLSVSKVLKSEQITEFEDFNNIIMRGKTPTDIERNDALKSARTDLDFILSFIKVFCVSSIFSQMVDSGCTEAIRMTKNIAQNAMAVASDARGLLNKKLFSEMTMRHSFSPIIIKELMNYSVDLFKQKTKVNLTNIEKYGPNLIDLFQVRIPFVNELGLHNVSASVDVVGFIYLIGKDVGDNSRKCIKLLSSMYKHMPEKYIEITNSNVKQLMDLHVQGPSKNPYHCHYGFCKWLSNHFTNLTSDDYTNIKVKILEDVCKYKRHDLVSEKVVKHWVFNKGQWVYKSIPNTEYFLMKLKEGVIEATDNLTQLISKLLKHESDILKSLVDKGIIKRSKILILASSNKGDNRNELREIYISPIWFRFLQDLLQIISKRIGEMFPEEIISKKGQYALEKCIDNINEMLTAIKKKPHLYSESKQLILYMNQDMTKFTSSMDLKGTLLILSDLISNLGTIGITLQIIIQLLFNKYQYVPIDIYKTLFGNYQKGDLDLIINPSIDNLSKRCPKLGKDQIDKLYHHIINNEHFSNLRQYHTKHPDFFDINGNIIYTTFGTPQGFLGIINSVTQVIKHRFRDNICSQNILNFENFLSLDSHDDHTSIIKIEKQDIFTYITHAWLVHFLTNSNINPQKTALTFQCEILSKFFIKGGLRYNYSKFMLVDPPILASQPESVLNLESIIKEGVTMGVPLELTIIKKTTSIIAIMNIYHTASLFIKLGIDKSDIADLLIKLPKQAYGFNLPPNFILGLYTSMEYINNYETTNNNIRHLINNVINNLTFLTNKSNKIDPNINNTFLMPSASFRDYKFQKMKTLALKMINKSEVEVKETITKYRYQLSSKKLWEYLPEEIRDKQFQWLVNLPQYSSTNFSANNTLSTLLMSKQCKLINPFLTNDIISNALIEINGVIKDAHKHNKMYNKNKLRLKINRIKNIITTNPSFEHIWKEYAIRLLNIENKLCEGQHVMLNTKTYLELLMLDHGHNENFQLSYMQKNLKIALNGLKVNDNACEKTHNKYNIKNKVNSITTAHKLNCNFKTPSDDLIACYLDETLIQFLDDPMSGKIEVEMLKNNSTIETFKSLAIKSPLETTVMVSGQPISNPQNAINYLMKNGWAHYTMTDDIDIFSEREIIIETYNSNTISFIKDTMFKLDAIYRNLILMTRLQDINIDILYNNLDNEFNIINAIQKLKDFWKIVTSPLKSSDLAYLSNMFRNNFLFKIITASQDNTLFYFKPSLVNVYKSNNWYIPTIKFMKKSFLISSHVNKTLNDAYFYLTMNVEDRQDIKNKTLCFITNDSDNQRVAKAFKESFLFFKTDIGLSVNGPYEDIHLLSEHIINRAGVNSNNVKYLQIYKNQDNFIVQKNLSKSNIILISGVKTSAFLNSINYLLPSREATNNLQNNHIMKGSHHLIINGKHSANFIANDFYFSDTCQKLDQDFANILKPTIDIRSSLISTLNYNPTMIIKYPNNSNKMLCVFKESKDMRLLPSIIPDFEFADTILDNVITKALDSKLSAVIPNNDEDFNTLLQNVWGKMSYQPIKKFNSSFVSKHNIDIIKTLIDEEGNINQRHQPLDNIHFVYIQSKLINDDVFQEDILPQFDWSSEFKYLIINIEDGTASLINKAIIKSINEESDNENSGSNTESSEKYEDDDFDDSFLDEIEEYEGYDTKNTEITPTKTSGPNSIGDLKDHLTSVLNNIYDQINKYEEEFKTKPITKEKQIKVALETKKKKFWQPVTNWLNGINSNFPKSDSKIEPNKITNINTNKSHQNTDLLRFLNKNLVITSNLKSIYDLDKHSLTIQKNDNTTYDISDVLLLETFIEQTSSFIIL